MPSKDFDTIYENYKSRAKFTVALANYNKRNKIETEEDSELTLKGLYWNPEKRTYEINEDNIKDLAYKEYLLHKEEEAE